MFPEFAFIHAPTFLSDLDAGRVDELKVCSILALCARYVAGAHDNVAQFSETFAQKAREEALRRATVKPDIYVLQSLLLLSLHDWGTCRGFQAWMTIGRSEQVAS